MKDNAKRLVFEDWMDTSAAMKVFETVEDIQVQKLHYDARTEENDVAMSRTHTDIRFSQERNSKFLGSPIAI